MLNADDNRIIYSINIEDVQNVAEQELGKKLTQKELKEVEDNISDYIDWYEAISLTLNDILYCKRK